jgi:hypothetical protein
MKYIIILLLCFFSVATYAQTQFFTGNTLKERCDDAESGVNSSFCLGYIIGVADSLSINICAPGGSGGVTVGQFVSIVRKYLNENPESLHRPADVLAFNALTRAFPCPKK